jgi:SAM-dependent methyltransferase
MMSLPRMYTDFAGWWPLLSAPSGYAEEALFYAVTIDAVARRPIATVLELGSGGGNNASYLKGRYRMTLADRSPAMLAISSQLNPECDHLAGDMRDIRLGRRFDAVLIHDAIMYMTTESDLAAAIRTAAEHLEPGGVALLVPDDTAETYVPSTSSGGNDGEGRAMRYLQWEHPAVGTTVRVTYILAMADGGGPVRVESDEHLVGVFTRDTWLRLIADAGLEARALPYVHSEFEHPRELFVGIRS